ncbi:MAG: hypothetical protein ACUVWK_01365 [Nitrososphaerales archaeon]
MGEHKGSSDEDIEATILFKLYRLGKWGANHTDFENLKKGFKPGELGKKGPRRVDRLAEDLIREGYLIPKITRYGFHVSLDPRKSKEIQKIIEDFMKRQLSP